MKRSNRCEFVNLEKEVLKQKVFWSYCKLSTVFELNFEHVFSQAKIVKNLNKTVIVQTRENSLGNMVRIQQQFWHLSG